MGNINNPCINRWGINSFWHHYWYSDKKYALLTQQDNFILLLLKTYLHYGTETPLNFLQNHYWYSTPRVEQNDLKTKDYRWYSVFEQDLGYSYNYIVRTETPEFFESYWTILRFNRWLIVSVQWFQPNKTKITTKKRLKTTPHLFVVTPTQSNDDSHQRLLVRTANLLLHKNYTNISQYTKYSF